MKLLKLSGLLFLGLVLHSFGMEQDICPVYPLEKRAILLSNRLIKFGTDLPIKLSSHQELTTLNTKWKILKNQYANFFNELFMIINKTKSLEEAKKLTELIKDVTDIKSGLELELEELKSKLIKKLEENSPNLKLGTQQ